MTTHSTIKRAFKLLMVLSILAISSSAFYEREFALNGMTTTGEIISFKKRAFSSAQGDSIEMEIEFTVDGKQRKFYSSRNVVEHLMGAYEVGDEVPVLYNPADYPYAKIGSFQHLYQMTLTFLAVSGILFVALGYAWFKSRESRF